LKGEELFEIKKGGETQIELHKDPDLFSLQPGDKRGGKLRRRSC